MVGDAESSNDRCEEEDGSPSRSGAEQRLACSVVIEIPEPSE